jgi:cytochrome P450
VSTDSPAREGARVQDFVHTRPIRDASTLPPGPRWPTGLQTLMFLTLRSHFLPRWHRRYGDVFSIKIAPAGRGVVLADPEHIREVFAGSAQVFHAGEGNAILGPIMGEHSVLLLDEEEHRATRKRVMAAFHGETMASYAPLIEQIAAQRVARWPVGRPIGLHAEMNEIRLEVILRIVFGVTDERRLQQMRPLIRRLVSVGPLIFLGWLRPQLQRHGPWRRFAQAQREAD